MLQVLYGGTLDEEKKKSYIYTRAHIIGSLHKLSDYCLITAKYVHRFTTVRVE